MTNWQGMNALHTCNYSPLIYKNIVLHILYIDRKNITSTRDPCDARDYVSVRRACGPAVCGARKCIGWQRGGTCPPPRWRQSRRRKMCSTGHLIHGGDDHRLVRAMQKLRGGRCDLYVSRGQDNSVVLVDFVKGQVGIVEVHESAGCDRSELR
jgi:hypothetical protein